VNLSDLTLIVPTCGYVDVSRSLYTYRRHAPGAKIIVIDQTPHGALGSDEIKTYTDVYVKVDRALGFSKAMNFGIALSDSPYIGCINDDVEFIHDKMWVGICEWLGKKDVAAVNPSSVKGYNLESDALPCNCGVELDEKNGNCPKCRAWKETYTDEDWDYLNSPREVKFSAITKTFPEMCVDGIMTWAMFIHRAALNRIRDNECYYDEKFYPGGGEDYDLMCRLYDAKPTGECYRAVGIYNSWAYHHWFGTKNNRSHERFFIEGVNKPTVIQELKYNDVDGKYKTKPTDPIIVKEGKPCDSNWDLWGRKDKSIPCPPCTRLKL